MTGESLTFGAPAPVLQSSTNDQPAEVYHDMGNGNP
jgi:hypothetical protein